MTTLWLKSDTPIELALSDLDTSLLHVVAFTGMAPEKVPVEFRLHTGKDHLLVFPAHQNQSLAQRFDWEGMAAGYYFKFADEEQTEDKNEKKDKKEKAEDEEKEKKSGRGKFARWLFSAAVDVVTEISEQADLRSWRTMPGAALAGYFPLAEGTYDISLRFLDARRQVLYRRDFQAIEVRRSRLNLLEAALLR